MTREEIVRNLKYVMKKHKDDRVNTFDINIYLMCKDILGYLEQEPCEDAISRQAVIDLIKENIRIDDDKLELIAYFVENMPSVKPQVLCKDAVSRQATIEAFQMFRGYEANRTNAEWVDRIETVVEKLPPVNPQEPLTEEDYIELHDRFGDYVEFVVRDMVSGKGERWKEKK